MTEIAPLIVIIAAQWVYILRIQRDAASDRRFLLNAALARNAMEQVALNRSAPDGDTAPQVRAQRAPEPHPVGL